METPKRIVDTWLIPSKTGVKRRVDLLSDGQWICSCNAKKKCVHIRNAKEWQFNENKIKF